MRVALLLAVFAVTASFVDSQNPISWFTDFEDGSYGPWSDVSTSDVTWDLETVGSNIMFPYSINVPVPPNGHQYLRAFRNQSGVSGSAVLQSDFFWALPGDAISMSFWIHSPQPKQNSLMIYWLSSTGEKQIFSGTNYSDPSNMIWRVECHQLPITQPTYTRINVYAFTETSFDDAIAIDDIAVGPVSDPNYCNGVFLPTPPPTTSTSTTTTTTTPAPTDPPVPDIEINFSSTTSSWTLSNMNGARWVRVAPNSAMTPISGIPPGYGDGYISIEQTSYYSGYAFAESPLYVIAPNRFGVINITFWMSGTVATPAYLTVGSKPDGLKYPDSPFLSLNSHGSTVNGDWVTVSSVIPYTTDPFQLVIEGYPGQRTSNRVAIAQIVLSGVEELQRPFPVTWDLENNSLNGWAMGQSQGSYWDVITESNGNQYLGVVSQISRPGMATVESPLLPPFFLEQQLQLVFRIKGNVNTPAELTARRRTADGHYDDLPFLDLRQYGSVGDSGWVRVFARLPASAVPFQVVLEGFLSYGADNMVAVDDVVLVSRSASGEQIETYLFK